MNAPARSSIALALLIVWFLLAVVVRVLVHLARTGSPGIKPLSSRAGVGEWIAAFLFVDAIVAAPAAALLHRFLPEELRWESGWNGTVGIALMGVGIVGTAFAQRAMGMSWRLGVDPTERTQLVVAGVFGLVRNPIYTAMLVTGLGLVLLVPNPLSLGALLLLVLALELQVRIVEEPYLERLHGPAFTDYSARVGRFWPGLGRSRSR